MTTTAQKSRPGMTAGAKVMAVLAVLALADMGATTTGVFNHQPHGNTSYAVFAVALTLAVWLLAVGKSLLPGRPTALGWGVMVGALAALHTFAAFVAVAGLTGHEVLLAPASLLWVVGGGAALLFLRRP